MRRDLIEVLRCPETGFGLEWAHIESVFELAGHEFVEHGVLRAQGQADHLYPVIDEIPRLVPRASFSNQERDFLQQNANASDAAGEQATIVVPKVFSQEEIEAEIRRRMERQYELTEDSPAKTRQRCEGEIRYMTAESRGTNKQKYVRLLTPYVRKLNSVLEIGGNFPGLTRGLHQRFAPSRAVVANLQILFPMAFKTATRDITAVRADVQALPFRRRSFELVASAFMLEHVPDWRAGLRSMMSSGERVWLAFGPNSHFPFEVGHINAPLAGTLPKPLAAYVAWAWLALVGRRRPLFRVREILGEVFHVSSRACQAEIRRLGGQPRNLFPDLIATIIDDQDAPSTGPRRLLKSLPRVSKASAKLLAAIGLEPQMYFLIDRR